MKVPVASLLLLLLFATAGFAVEHRVEPLAEEAPTDEVSAEIRATLMPTGWRVLRGTQTTVCDIWLSKEWATKDGFEATPAIQYPFVPGQLIGVVRYARRGADFRDQVIDRGVYTLRFALQPVDGSHVGTSLTRDFLVLLKPESDESAATLDYPTLAALSAEAAGSSHPALLSLQRVTKAMTWPAMRHNEEHDWWIVGLEGRAVGGGPLPIEVVIAGVTAE